MDISATYRRIVAIVQGSINLDQALTPNNLAPAFGSRRPVAPQTPVFLWMGCSHEVDTHRVTRKICCSEAARQNQVGRMVMRCRRCSSLRPTRSGKMTPERNESAVLWDRVPENLRIALAGPRFESDQPVKPHPIIPL